MSRISKLLENKDTLVLQFSEKYFSKLDKNYVAIIEMYIEELEKTKYRYIIKIKIREYGDRELKYKKEIIFNDHQEAMKVFVNLNSYDKIYDYLYNE